MKNSKKRFIPGTNPKWGRELPNSYDNSYTDKYGNSYDNGWNFDKKDKEDTITWGQLAEMPAFSKPPEKPEPAERIFFGKTKDGASVYDRADSHFHPEGGLTPELLREAISKIDTEGKTFIKEKVDFDHAVGKKTCVSVGPEDEVMMVYRKGRNGQTPMVKNREAEPCNSVTIILKKDLSIQDKDVYETLTSYVGEGSPREPWDPNFSSDEERQKAKDFWNSHALIYNDQLINWEKTKEYESMPASTKRIELIRPKVVYTGLFIDSEDLYQKKPPTLEKPIEYPHVTANFKPMDVEQLHLNSLGDDAKIFAIGYGNDGKNEGLLVKIESEDPELQAVYDKVETPHITLSISKDGQAKDTAFLDFSPLDEPFELTGKYGWFGQGKLIENQEDITELED